MLVLKGRRVILLKFAQSYNFTHTSITLKKALKNMLKICKGHLQNLAADHLEDNHRKLSGEKAPFPGSN